MRSLLETSNLRGMAVLLSLGLVVGLVSNLTAGSTRKLDWGRDYPAKAKPNCPDTLPESAAAAAQVGEPATSTAAVQAPPPEGAAVSAPTGGEASATPAPDAGQEPGAPPSASAAAIASAPSAGAAAPAPAEPADGAAATATATPVPPEPASGVAAVEVPPVPDGQPWIELAPAQVEALFERGALFVDARMTSQYEEGHVKGALSIPIWESGVDEKVQQVVFEAEGDKARPIVVYCNGGDCQDSHDLGQKLWENGHVAVYVYKDGYPDWIRRGHPVGKGSVR